jgi:SAM-dependent methyltransferase
LKKPGLAVLEPMCGYAGNKKMLEEHLGSSLSYTGFDYSGRVLEKLASMDLRPDVFKQDITAYRPPPNAYDLMLIVGGLHHIPDFAEDVLKTLIAGIKPGGWFVSLEPTFGNPVFHRIRKRIYRRNQAFDDRTERDFSVSELLALFTGAGFVLKDIFFPGLLGYVLYYNPEAFPKLNFGRLQTVTVIFRLDRMMMSVGLGRLFSFATLSLWQRPG